MRKRKVGVIDILSKTAHKRGIARVQLLNYTSIMPQVVAVWCEEFGHDVSMGYHYGPKMVAGGLPDDVDVVFINAFSKTALVAYALSHYYRSKGAVTVLGGPHARAYPEDAIKYFDYAVGFCDKELLRDILQDCAPHRPQGHYLSAKQQPPQLAGMRQRWKFMTPLYEKSRLLRAIPIIGSLGCPYTCSFCIDAIVPYQPLAFEQLKEDLRFVVENKPSRSLVVWHDPNFGVRFDDYLNVIEEAVPPGSLRFLAESTLSLLNEKNVKRLAKIGFKVLLPGIESWFDVGDKAKMRSIKGMEKVRRVAEQANMILRYIPYVHTNLIFGLDADEGPEPFDLTKRFIDLAPGVHPRFSMLTSYGHNAPDNLRYQRDGRVLNMPFHFVSDPNTMNVRPKNYTWPEFSDHIVDVCAYAFSARAIYRRFKAQRNPIARYDQALRDIMFGRKDRYQGLLTMRRRLDDPTVRSYFEGESTVLPPFFVEPVQKDLGWLWEWLPEGALYHDPNAHLTSLEGRSENLPSARAGKAVA